MRVLRRIVSSCSRPPDGGPPLGIRDGYRGGDRGGSVTLSVVLMRDWRSQTRKAYSAVSGLRWSAWALQHLLCRCRRSGVVVCRNAMN